MRVYELVGIGDSPLLSEEGTVRVIYTLRQFVQRFMAYRTFDNGAH